MMLTRRAYARKKKQNKIQPRLYYIFTEEKFKDFAL